MLLVVDWYCLVIIGLGWDAEVENESIYVAQSRAYQLIKNEKEETGIGKGKSPVQGERR